MRFVRGQLFVRLNLSVSDDLLTRLNDEFSDLLESGRIDRATASLGVRRTRHAGTAAADSDF